MPSINLFAVGGVYVPSVCSYQPCAPFPLTGATTKVEVTRQYDALAKTINDFIEEAKPWGTGLTPFGGLSTAGKRQVARLQERLKQLLELVEKMPDEPPAAKRGRGGGRTSAGGSSGAPTDGAGRQPAEGGGKQAPGGASATEVLSVIIKQQQEQIAKLKEDALAASAASAPPAAQAAPAAPAPAPPAATELSVTSAEEAPVTLADRYFQQQVPLLLFSD